MVAQAERVTCPELLAVGAVPRAVEYLVAVAD